MKIDNNEDVEEFEEINSDNETDRDTISDKLSDEDIEIRYESQKTKSEYSSEEESNKTISSESADEKSNNEEQLEVIQIISSSEEEMGELQISHASEEIEIDNETTNILEKNISQYSGTFDQESLNSLNTGEKNISEFNASLEQRSEESVNLLEKNISACNEVLMNDGEYEVQESRNDLNDNNEIEMPQESFAEVIICTIENIQTEGPQRATEEQNDKLEQYQSEVASNVTHQPIEAEINLEAVNETMETDSSYLNLKSNMSHTKDSSTTKDKKENILLPTDQLKKFHESATLLESKKIEKTTRRITRSRSAQPEELFNSSTLKQTRKTNNQLEDQSSSTSNVSASSTILTRQKRASSAQPEHITTSSKKISKSSTISKKDELESSDSKKENWEENENNVLKSTRSNVQSEQEIIKSKDDVSKKSSATPRSTRRSSIQSEDSTDIQERPILLKKGRKSSVQSEENEPDPIPTRRTRQSSVQSEESITKNTGSTPKRSRRTRSSSQQETFESLEQTQDVSIKRKKPASIASEDNVTIKQTRSTPTRRTRRSSSLLEEKFEDVKELITNQTPQASLKRNTRRTSIQSEDSATLKNSKTTPVRRSKRISFSGDDAEDTDSTSQSVQESVTSTRSTKKTSMASGESTTLGEVSHKRRGRKSSIQEGEQNSKEINLSNVAKKQIEEYSSTHRLTRRQREMMEKSIVIQEMKKLQKEQVSELYETNSTNFIGECIFKIN